ncbi:MAG: hypothetical protein II820_03130 [Ruminiclostridium sp.]|nr:hypothetical protein [Ruminiclostridium sp.]
MSRQGSEFYNNFTKDIFNTIKGISDDERGDYIIQTYENLYNRLSEEDKDSQPQTPAVDLAKLREDLSHVRGIGGQRLDEIMAVIERHLFPAPDNTENKSEENERNK